MISPYIKTFLNDMLENTKQIINGTQSVKENTDKFGVKQR
jgi:hypothetical protein